MRRFWMLAAGVLLVVSGLMIGCSAYHGGCGPGGCSPAGEAYGDPGVGYQTVPQQQPGFGGRSIGPANAVPNGSGGR